MPNVQATDEEMRQLRAVAGKRLPKTHVFRGLHERPTASRDFETLNLLCRACGSIPIDPLVPVESLVNMWAVDALTAPVRLPLFFHCSPLRHEVDGKEVQWAPSFGVCLRLELKHLAEQFHAALPFFNDESLLGRRLIAWADWEPDFKKVDPADRDRAALSIYHTLRSLFPDPDLHRVSLYAWGQMFGTPGASDTVEAEAYYRDVATVKGVVADRVKFSKTQKPVPPIRVWWSPNYAFGPKHEDTWGQIGTEQINEMADYFRRDAAVSEIGLYDITPSADCPNAITLFCEYARRWSAVVGGPIHQAGKATT